MSFILSLMLTIVGAFGLAGMAVGQARAAEIAGAASLVDVYLTEHNMLRGDELYAAKYPKTIRVDFVESINKIETVKNRPPRYIYLKGPFTYANDA